MDEQMNLLESEVRFLTKRLWECEGIGRKWSPEEENSTQRVIRDFLRQNATLLRRAGDAYAKLSQSQRTELCEQYSLTGSIVNLPSVGEFILDAVSDAESEISEVLCSLMPYEAQMLEMIPRVLSYAKYVVSSGDMKVMMSPVLAHLPRHLVKEALVKPEGNGVRICIMIRGGLTEENEAAFESIRFPDGLQLRRATSEMVGSPEDPQCWDKPFHAVLYCPEASPWTAREALEASGFVVERD